MKIDLVPQNPLAKIVEPAPDRQPAPGEPGAQPPAPPAPPTPDEVKERVKESFDAMGWGAPTEDVTKAVTEAVPTQPAAAPAPAAPAPGAQPPAGPAGTPPAEPPAEGEPEPEPPLSSQELISQTAKAVATEVAKVVRPEASSQPPPASAPTVDLAPEDAELYEIVRWLEQSGDAKYRGLGEKFMAHIRAVYAYQDEWSAKNPDKVYNANDDEHTEFYEKNAFPLSDSELEQAKMDIIAERRATEQVRPLQEKVTAMETERTIQAAAPVIESNYTKSVYLLVQNANPELAALLLDGQNISFADDRIAAVEAKDPIAKEVLDKTATEIRPLIVELEKHVATGGKYRLDPQNPVHAELLRYQDQAERDLSRAPENIRTRDGKQFVTRERMQTLKTEAVRGASAQERQARIAEVDRQYWCIDADLVEGLIAYDFGQRAKKVIEETDRLGQKKYGTTPASRPAAAAPTPGNQPPAPAPAARPSNGKPRSPSSSSASDIVTTPQNGGDGQKSFGEKVAASLFS